MKNILNYYYQIIIDDDNIDYNGYFTYNNHSFCLYQYKRSINEIEALTLLNKMMLTNNMSINRIIYNVFNQAITIHDNKNYALIEINYQCNSFSNIKFIESFNNYNLDVLKRNNWSELWSIKIDYIEYQLEHIQNSYPLINDSINYYIGLAENAISYFNMLNLSNISLYISHRRINKETMFNPLELVIDYKVRDVGEYIKYSFFNKIMTIEEIKNYLKKINLDDTDYFLLYIRLLFPSYYFDLYEEIVNNGVDEEKIKNVLLLSNSYEKLLNEIYLIIKNRENILKIDWLNNSV